LLAIQIAAPVLGVSLVIDAALGVMAKAVPQMPVFLVGIPAKTALGLMAVALTLPALTGAVSNGIQLALQNLTPVFRGG
jgi:flagellar biosynthesis protein FliR